MVRGQQVVHRVGDIDGLPIQGRDLETNKVDSRLSAAQRRGPQAYLFCPFR